MSQNQSGNRAVFVRRQFYNKPDRIVTLGHYYPQNQIGGAKEILHDEIKRRSDALRLEIRTGHSCVKCQKS